MKRDEILQALQADHELDVLVIGGGVNGIGTFRDVALQGARVLLVEKDDFCGGASAASSHMLHGGIRYLENGEFRLVREALHERNRLLKNARHYAKPLPTAIPVFRWFSGLFNAPLKFLGLLNRPAERGAVVIKLGLMMYDAFTGKQQTMPYHKLYGRDEGLRHYPRLNVEIVSVATYYDAFIPYPERLCMEMILDTEAASDQAYALNYMPVIGASGDSVTLRDALTEQELIVKPKVVINAAGPWIDFVNQALDKPTQFIGGTKGSHLILDHPELRAATSDSEIFFENKDGRIVLILPYLDKVMIGTTDIRIDDPEQAVCTDEEIDYMLDLVKRVFPTIEVDRSQIVFQFSGVRPLPASDTSRTGAISRDHSIQSSIPNEQLKFPVHSLIGGKWTTFRAFSEQAANVALRDTGIRRRVTTESLPIGGGTNLPPDEKARAFWLKQTQQQTELPLEQLALLLDRYGTYAAEIAAYIGADNDEALDHVPGYTQREIEFIAINEKVESTADFILRRSLIGMLGYANPDSIEEIGEIIGAARGWSPKQIRDDIRRTTNTLRTKHGMEM
jgi:glycerol-3-phosphate dehydrogenase